MRDHRMFVLCLSLLLPAMCAAEAPAPPPAPPPTPPAVQPAPPAAVQPVQPKPEDIKALIQKLNAPDTVQREEAERALLQIGQPALEALKDAVTSPEQEIALRAQKLIAKLSDVTFRPAKSWAEVFPANSVLFLEFPNVKASLDRIKTTPLGRFWDTQAMQTFYKGHYDNQLPNDQKMLDCCKAIPKLIDGRAVLALGAGDTAEAAELDPPMVYIIESKQLPEMEEQVRNLLDSMSEPLRETQPYGKFTVELGATAQTVFGQNTVLHSRTEKGMHSLLDNLTQRPEKPLDPLLADIRKVLPNYDAVLHISRAMELLRETTPSRCSPMPECSWTTTICRNWTRWAWLKARLTTKWRVLTPMASKSTRAWPSAAARKMPAFSACFATWRAASLRPRPRPSRRRSI